MKAQEQEIESRNTQFLIQVLGNSIDIDRVKPIFAEKIWDTFDDWWETNGALNNPDAFAYWFCILYGYKITGTLLRRGFLNIEVIDDLMSRAILMRSPK